MFIPFYGQGRGFASVSAQISSGSAISVFLRVNNEFIKWGQFCHQPVICPSFCFQPDVAPIYPWLCSIFTLPAFRLDESIPKQVSLLWSTTFMETVVKGITDAQVTLPLSRHLLSLPFCLSHGSSYCCFPNWVHVLVAIKYVSHKISFFCPF